MLYATGKRGHHPEGLYLTVCRDKFAQAFNFRMYGDTGDLKIGSGLRVGDDGVSFNRHFLPPSKSSFEFLAGEYSIKVYARVVNKSRPIALATVSLLLSDEHAVALHDPTTGWVQFGQTQASETKRS
jgi:hypothetical protein